MMTNWICLIVVFFFFFIIIIFKGKHFCLVSVNLWSDKYWSVEILQLKIRIKMRWILKLAHNIWALTMPWYGNDLGARLLSHLSCRFKLNSRYYCEIKMRRKNFKEPLGMIFPLYPSRAGGTKCPQRRSGKKVDDDRSSADWPRHSKAPSADRGSLFFFWWAYRT